MKEALVRDVWGWRRFVLQSEGRRECRVPVETKIRLRRLRCHSFNGHMLRKSSTGMHGRSGGRMTAARVVGRRWLPLCVDAAFGAVSFPLRRETLGSDFRGFESKASGKATWLPPAGCRCVT